jgi:hypothetical protein
MKYCENCDKAYNDKMRFCVICGHTLTQESPSSDIQNDNDAYINTDSIQEPEQDSYVSDEVLLPDEATDEAAATDEVTATDEIITDEATVTDEAAVTEEAALTEEIVINDAAVTEETQTQDETIIPSEPVISDDSIIPDEEPVFEAVSVGMLSENADTSDEPADSALIPVYTHRRVKFYRNPGFALLSVFLGLLSFAFFIAAGVSYTARLLTYPETLSEITETVDILNLPIGDTPVIKSKNRDTTVMEAVYVLADGSGLTEEDIEELYEKTSFREDLTDILTEYADWLRTGNLPANLTTDDIKDIFLDNLDYINRLLSKAGERSLSDGDIALAMAYIDDTDDLLRSLSVRNLPIDSSTVGIIRVLMSPPVIIAEIVLAVLLIIIIGAANRNFYPSLRIGGLSALFAGALFALVLFLIRYQVIALFPMQSIGIVLADISAVIGPNLYIFAGIVAGVGVMLLISARTLKWARTRVA